MDTNKRRMVWAPLVCFLILSNCAKHKLAPLGASAPVTPAVAVPAPPPVRILPTQPEKNVIQAKRAKPDLNSLLNEPPRMTFSPDRNVIRKEVPQKIDKITILVDTTEGKLRPDSEAIIQIALKPLASEFLFLCPDQMRLGSPADCRFSTKESLSDFFKDQLLALGVDPAQAGAATILVRADLTSHDKNAFDIRAVPASSSSSNDRIWHVVPHNPGDHKLDLTVTASARIVSAGDVQGEPVEMVRSVAVIGVGNFLNGYGTAVFGCLAALGLLAGISWALWRGARPPAFSSR